MNAAACLTLAGFYCAVWCKQRESWVHLLFSSSAVAAAAIAAFELAMMHAGRSGNTKPSCAGNMCPPGCSLSVSSSCDSIFTPDGGGSRGVSAACGQLVLILNFVFMLSINFREITIFRQFSWGGEIISVPIGAASPWGLLSSLSLLLLLIFFVDDDYRLAAGRPATRLVVGGR